MADVNAVPVQDFGNLLTSFQQGQAAAAANNAGAQERLANIPLLQAQTTQAQLQNQRAALQMIPFRAAIAQAMSDQSGVNPSGGDTGASRNSVGDTDLDVDDLSGHAQQNFAPIPTAPPPQVMKQAQLYALGGQPELAKMTLEQWQAQVGAANTRRQQAADLSYQHMAAVANADDPVAMLNRLEPQVAASLTHQYANDTPEQLAKDVKDFATHYAGVVHPYSGRPTDFTNGVLVDKNSSKQVVGTDKIYTGLNAEDLQKTWDWLGQPVTIGDGLPTPRWQTLTDQRTGKPFASQEEALAAGERAARNPVSPGNAPGAAPAPAQGAGATPVRAVPGTAQPGGNIVAGATAPQTTPPATSVNGSAPAAPAAGVSSPAAPNAQANDPMRAALADADFRYKPPQMPRATDQPTLEANKETAKTAANQYQTNSNDLKKQGDEVTAASSQALQRFQYAKQLLAKPDSYWTAGVPGEVTAQLARFGINTPAGADRAEILKSLTQGALQGLKTTYGARPAMFDVKVNLEQAFPDPKTMNVKQLNATIDDNVRALNYDIQSGRRVLPYLRSGNDPSQFNTWNEKYFQRAANVNAGPGSPNNGYSASNGGGTVRVINPNGQSGSIPASQLEQAIAAGYKRAQ